MAGGVNEKTCAEKRFLYGDQTQPRAFPFHLFHRCDRMCLLFGNTCLGAGYALFGRRVLRI